MDRVTDIIPSGEKKVVLKEKDTDMQMKFMKSQKLE